MAGWQRGGDGADHPQVLSHLGVEARAQPVQVGQSAGYVGSEQRFVVSHPVAEVVRAAYRTIDVRRAVGAGWECAMQGRNPQRLLMCGGAAVTPA